MLSKALSALPPPEGEGNEDLCKLCQAGRGKWWKSSQFRQQNLISCKPHLSSTQAASRWFKGTTAAECQEEHFWQKKIAPCQVFLPGKRTLAGVWLRKRLGLKRMSLQKASKEEVSSSGDEYVILMTLIEATEAELCFLIALEWKSWFGPWHFLIFYFLDFIFRWKWYTLRERTSPGSTWGGYTSSAWPWWDSLDTSL